jgi:hypothetical protein
MNRVEFLIDSGNEASCLFSGNRLRGRVKKKFHSLARQGLNGWRLGVQIETAEL